MLEINVKLVLQRFIDPVHIFPIDINYLLVDLF
jgi:hypothetical protein